MNDSSLKGLKSNGIYERVYTGVHKGKQDGCLVPFSSEIEFHTEVETKESEMIRRPADNVDDEYDNDDHGGVTISPQRFRFWFGWLSGDAFLLVH